MQTTEAARARARLLQSRAKVEEAQEIKDEKEKKVPVKRRSSMSVPGGKSYLLGVHHPRGRRQRGPHRRSDVASVKSIE
jgi:hypothetical protein